MVALWKDPNGENVFVDQQNKINQERSKAMLNEDAQKNPTITENVGLGLATEYKEMV